LGTERIDRGVSLQNWTQNGTRACWITETIGAQAIRLGTKTDPQEYERQLDDSQRGIETHNNTFTELCCH